ncbi:MAG: adenosylcobinamide-phosphate synthase CbiB [Candidatus Methanomethylophilaceae archaeon]|jgi:adenosylcobinamide-phosphate synthase
MELWVDAVFVILVALLIDRFIGELPNRFHPLRWLGLMLGWIDRHITDRGRIAKLWGFLSYLAMFLLILFVTLSFITVVCMLVAKTDISFDIGTVSVSLAEIVWILLTGLFMKVTFAVFSFRKHCRPIQDDLRSGKVEDAAVKVQMIVSRNTEGMDAEHIASSCCETITENLVDSVMSPTFYGGLLGLPGAIMFRCANLMDAMWGYLNEKYGNLGFFPAKFDDVLGFLTARVSPYFVVLAAKIMRFGDHPSITEAAKNEHTKTPSPNSGYPMTACAAALGISMEKKGVYVMGTGHLPTVDDITRCYHLVELTSIIFILLIMLPLYALIGVHVQVFFEGILGGLFGGLI